MLLQCSAILPFSSRQNPMPVHLTCFQVGAAPRYTPWCVPSQDQRTVTASPSATRSEEHTSELQSPYDLVCRLLLEKKKKTEDKKNYDKTSTRASQTHTS